MFFRLLTLESKSLLRSAHVGQSITMKIVLAIFGLLLTSGLWSIGHNIYDMLDESSDSVFPMQQVNHYFLFYFVAELGLRFFMQQLPILNVKPFLVQRISRNTLTHFLLSKSVFSFYNLVAPLLFIPFGMACWSAGDYSAVHIFCWLAAVIGTSLSLNFFNLSLQHTLSASWRATGIALTLLITLIVLDYLHLFSSTDQIANFYESVLLHPLLCIIPLVLVGVAYLWIHHSLRQRLYLENNSNRRKQSIALSDFSWLDQLGRYAPLIRLDLKLLWRNKRTKTMLVTGIIGLLYGLIFYPNQHANSQGMLVFVGTFMTGLFVFNFGQFVPAWDSSYYPLIHTQKIVFTDYLRAKSMLFYGSIILATILTIPYLYFGKEILMINLVTAVYNIGINVPIILFFGTYNKKRVDLDKSQFFNYQGMGATQWIIMLPAIFIPVILWSIIHAFASFEITCLIFVAVGIAGLCLRSVFFKSIARRYKKNKYAMLEGFKQVSE